MLKKSEKDLLTISFRVCDCLTRRFVHLCVGKASNSSGPCVQCHASVRQLWHSPFNSAGGDADVVLDSQDQAVSFLFWRVQSENKDCWRKGRDTTISFQREGRRIKLVRTILSFLYWKKFILSSKKAMSWVHCLLP